MALSPAAQAQFNRIIRGRPPNPGKASLNEAINFINANPSLRRIREGGFPTGLSKEGREQFRRQEQARIEAGGRQAESTIALGKIAKVKREREIKKAVRQAESTIALGKIAKVKREREIKKIIKPRVMVREVKLTPKVEFILRKERERKKIRTKKGTIIGIKKDIKEGKVTGRLKNLVDIISGGALTERRIEKEQSSLNERTIKFNNKFGQKELSESQFKKADAEKSFIDAEQKKIDGKKDSLVKSGRNELRNFIIKFDLRKTPRLTVKEQEKVEKARVDNKTIQNEIKKNKPLINKKNKLISDNNEKIKDLQKKDRNTLEDLRLFKLKNNVNNLRNDISKLEFKSPPKILAGSLPIVPASVPSGITKIKFRGIQKVDEQGRIVTDILFRTNKGREGIAKGVRGAVSKDGKTIELVLGQSGKVAVKFPSGVKKLIKPETFVSIEQVSSKTKALKIIVSLTKNGELTTSKAKKLKNLVKRLFKEDIRKISIKKLKILQKKITKAKKIRVLDLTKNLQRLRRRGLLKISKPPKRVKAKPIFKLRLRKPKVPKLISPKKIIKKAIKKIKKTKKIKKIDTITKKEFLKKIKSLVSARDISKKLGFKLSKRVKRLSKKGKIPRSEFTKIVEKIKPPTPLKIGEPIKKIKKPKRLKEINLERNLARLIKKLKLSLKKTPTRTRTLRQLDIKRNITRLRKKGKILPSPRETARDPGFGKIIKRLRREALQVEKAGRLKKVNINLKILEQRGVGKSISVKGKKFFRPGLRFPSGKLIKKRVKPLSKEDFASISGVLTKGDLSLIIGRSITRAKDKAEFIGLIKGVGKGGKSVLGGKGKQQLISKKTKQQFETALKKVITKVSSAIAMAEKTEVLKTKATQLAGAVAVLSSKALSAKQKSIIKSSISPIKKVVKAPTIQSTKTKIIQSLINKQATVQRAITKQRSKVKQIAQQKSKTSQAVKQKTNQRIAQLQKQKLALRKKQKQITKQILRARPGITPPRFPRLPRFVKIRKKKRRAKPKPKEKVKAFNVFARPLKKRKGAKRPKLVKVNKVPLRKTRAKDLRNYIADTSLARTAKIESTKGKTKPSKLRIPSGYAKRTSKKFRRHRIVKGRRKLLPKGKVIEKSRYLLDTRQEKRKITLRRRIAQITKKPIFRRKKGGDMMGIKRKRLSSIPKGRITSKKVEGGFEINIKGKLFDEVADKRSARAGVKRIRRLREEDKKKRKR